MFRYTPGKADWLASGRPSEGRAARHSRVGARAHRDIPLCRLGERVETVRARVGATRWSEAVVVDAHGVVMGVLDARALDGDGGALVDAVMQPAPSTIRPQVTLRAAKEYLHRDAQHLLVTTSDGTLIGALTRAELETAAQAA